MNFINRKLLAISFLSMAFWVTGAQAKLQITDGPNGIVVTEVETGLPTTFNGSVLANPSGRIVGGVMAARSDFPEFALVITFDSAGNGYICGGTKIDSRKILTAAHCLQGRTTNNVIVVPNFYSFNDYASSADLFDASISASSYKNHPQFNSNTFDNDIAIITLTSNASGTTASVYGGKKALAGVTATPTGVGTTSEGGNTANTLRKVNVPTLTNASCRNKYGIYGIGISSKMICAGLNSGGKDSCQGDSGGPLFVNIDGSRVQAGITSFGIGCARANLPGVYARTSALISFVKQYAPGTEIITDSVIRGNNKPVVVPAVDLLLE